MKQRIFVIATAALFGLFLLACGDTSGPSTTDTKPPNNQTTTVKSREVRKNLPGGEGKDHILIHICWHGKDEGCGNYKPSSVTRCAIGAAWSSCKDN